METGIARLFYTLPPRRWPQNILNNCFKGTYNVIYIVNGASTIVMIIIITISVPKNAEGSYSAKKDRTSKLGVGDCI